MEISKKGLDLIKKFEGLRLVVYGDVAGYPTVGYGHKIRPEDGLKLGDRITQEQADRFLEDDVTETETVVRRLCPGIDQNKFDALVSFAFNVGTGRFSKSTLCRLVRAGHFTEAAKEFPRWVYAGGFVVQGLVARRLEEQKLFIGRYL